MNVRTVGSKNTERREQRGFGGSVVKVLQLPFPLPTEDASVPSAKSLNIPSPVFQPRSLHLCRVLSPLTIIWPRIQEGAKTKYLCSIYLQLRTQVLEFYSAVESNIQILYSASGHFTGGSYAINNQPLRPQLGPECLLFSCEFVLDPDCSPSPYFTCVAVCGVSFSWEAAKSLENLVSNEIWELGRGFTCLRSTLLRC